MKETQGEGADRLEKIACEEMDGRLTLSLATKHGKRDCSAMISIMATIRSKFTFTTRKKG